MPFLLALLAHSAVPQSEPVVDATRCAVAVTIVESGSTPSTTLMAHVTYFIMQAASGAGPDGFLERIQASTAEMRKLPVSTADDAAAMMPQCDRRYPLARAKPDVRLPADALDRDVMCAAMIGLLAGAAEGFKEDTGDASEFDRLTASMNAFTGRFDEARLTAAGLDTEGKFKTAMQNQMIASLELGNAERIERACTATLKRSTPSSRAHAYARTRGLAARPAPARALAALNP